MKERWYNWTATFEDGRSFVFPCERTKDVHQALSDREGEIFDEYEESIGRELEMEEMHKWPGWFTTDENNVVSMVRGEEIITP